MKNRKFNIFCFLCFFFAFASSAWTDPAANFQSARVLRIIDGDTVEVLIDQRKEKLRLIGIDTPETKHPRKPVECWGPEATAEAKRLLSGRDILLEFDNSQGQRGRYGRVLVYVWVKGLHYNLHMIQNGFAREYTYRKPYKYQRDFQDAENEAIRQNRGLWGNCGR